MRVWGFFLFIFTLNASAHFLDPIDKDLLLFLGIERGILYQKKHLEKCTNELAEWTTNSCNILSYLKTNHKNLDESIKIFEQSQVVYVGETHLDQGAKHYLKRVLPDLKKIGYEVLAMEMFNQVDQDSLDKYLNNEISLNDLKVVMQKAWFYELSAYLELIEEAKFLGMRIVALDDRLTAPKEPMLENLIYRDEKMSQQLLRELQSGSHKIIAFTGGLHAQCSWSKKLEVQSQSQRLMSMANVSVGCLTIRERKKGSDPISEIFFSQVSSLPAYIPLDRNIGYSDGFILLPSNF